MLHRSSIVAAVAVAPFLLALEMPAERIAFAPTEGTSLDKAFSTELSMTLDEMDLLMNGEPFPMAMEMDMNISSTMTVEVTDSYVGMADGQPSVLGRSFTTLERASETSMSSPMMGDQDMSSDESSELDGMDVVFTWDAEAEDYTVAFAEGSEGDDELLEDLREDMDLRELLPDGDVSVGESWELDPEVMISVLAPGGDLKIKPDADTMEEMGGMPGGDMGMDDMLGDVSGSVVATLTGLRDGEDGQLAVITLEIELESTNDLTEMVREMMEDADLPEQVGGMDIESVDVEVNLEAEGTLIWSLAGGHFVELDLSCEMEVVNDQAMSIDMGGDSATMEQAMTFSSSLSVNYTASAN